MPAIEVSNLQKTFQTKRKAEGPALLGSPYVPARRAHGGQVFLSHCHVGPAARLATTGSWLGAGLPRPYQRACHSGAGKEIGTSAPRPTRRLTYANLIIL